MFHARPVTRGISNVNSGWYGEDADADEFDVEIASTKQRIRVAAAQNKLAEAGIQVEMSCISGLCGACKVRYLAGEPDHRDFILSDDEKDSYLTTCVPR